MKKMKTDNVAEKKKKTENIDNQQDITIKW